MILSVIAPMGKGKTLFSSLYALEYSKTYPDNKIIANYHLNVKNFEYSPYMFLNFNSLTNCLIICDDFYAIPNSKSLLGVIVNMSRKLSIEVILSCQYYTMIEPVIRTLSTLIEVEYSKKYDTLISKYQLEVANNQYIYRKFYTDNITVRAKGLYNTNEVVKFSSESEIKKQILQFSKDVEELELNISLFTKNKSEQKRLFKELSHFL